LFALISGSCPSSYYPDARGIRGILRLSTGQRPSTPGTRHCDFSSRQRSFHRIFGQRTALTLIRLIKRSGASSNSKCTSRGCTTPMNWNYVCSKCGATSTRASLTMQLTSGTAQASSCMHTGERMTLWAYAVENNSPVSIQPYDNINV